VVEVAQSFLRLIESSPLPVYQRPGFYLDISGEELKRVESTLSKREPRVKLWKGFQRGEVWGTLLGRYGTPQFSRGGA